ncbi:LysR family transcriptional regulator [Allohahella marinimesophila]|uniref:LysR family transcriptional regulator n=1 Tax=Allohahella marinimesophila TaxID=1054972 RepID=A0ABP7NGH1_9GAMM
MKLEQLRVLDAIVTEGSFREAAAALHRSQPALSQMMKALENEIGVVLLSREAYRPRLTADGEAFYRQAKAVLGEMQLLSSLAYKLAARQEPEVRLSITATCPLRSLLDSVGRTSMLYPETHIRLISDAMGGSAERLMTGEADIVISTLDGLSTDAIEALPYTTVDIIPVARPDYGPARRHRNNKVDMSRFTQVVVSGTGHGVFEQSRDVLEAGLRWTVSDFAAKKEVILSGMGWGGLPEHLIRAELDDGALEALEIENFPVRHSRLYQIRRRAHETGLVAEALWEALAKGKT